MAKAGPHSKCSLPGGGTAVARGKRQGTFLRSRTGRRGWHVATSMEGSRLLALVLVSSAYSPQPCVLHPPSRCGQSVAAWHACPPFALKLYSILWRKSCVTCAPLAQAYDRVVAPDELVTTGVYRFVQHPIYTSYMLLFCGFCLSLHSAPSALLVLLVCGADYRCGTCLAGAAMAWGGVWVLKLGRRS